MMTVLGLMIFAGGLGAVAAVFAFTLVPALPRIAALLRGEAPTILPPRLVIRERHARPRLRMMPILSRQESRAAA